MDEDSKEVGEITLIAVGEKFDKALPAQALLFVTLPNGQVQKYDVLDFLHTDWYE